MAYIGLDIGTSGCKAAIVNEDGKIIAAAHAEYELLFLQKGFVELNPVEIYEKVKLVLKELAFGAKGVKALALSSFGEAFVLLDDENKPLNNFITYADNRCEGMDKEVMEQLSAQRIFEITGVYPNQTLSLYKLLWFRKNNPEILDKTKAMFFANDYYNFLFSGQRGVDCGTASKSMMADVKKRDWSEEITKKFQIPRQWLSPILEVGTFLGKIRGHIAKELGLPKDISIYMGCHDQCSSTLGGGACSPGNVILGEGSTESINLITDDSIFQHAGKLFERKMCIETFVGNNYYMLPGGFLTYGNAIRWYLRTLEKEKQRLLSVGEDIFEYLERVCQKETELVFLPYLSSINLMNPDTLVPGAFVGITLETEKWEFYRSLIQGLNFESKNNFDVIEEIGVPINHICATGGITKSDLFMQLKADVLQKNIHILNNFEAGIIGLAMICAVACKDCEGYLEAVDRFVKVKKVVKPRKDYTKAHIEYNKIKDQLSQKRV